MKRRKSKIIEKRKPIKMDPVLDSELQRFLATTPNSYRNIGEVLDLDPRFVREFDHKHNVRPPWMLEEAQKKRGRIAGRNTRVRAKKERAKKAVRKLTEAQKNEIIKKNRKLFYSAMRDYKKRYPGIFRSNKWSFDATVQDFIIHCRERLEIYDKKRGEFSSFVFGLVDNFMLSKINRLVESIKPKPVQTTNSLSPRGWGTIPVGPRRIWLTLGLPLQIAVEAGANETKKQLHALAEKSNLTLRQLQTIKAFINEHNIQKITQMHHISQTAIYRLRKYALIKMRKQIEANNSGRQRT